MPRTTYRFRVAPLIITESSDDSNEQTVEQGEWSEISNITTKDNQSFDFSNMGGLCASLVTRGRKKWLNFEKAGTMLAQYGYSFGEHLWELKISYS
jgi:hypothetical protein